MKFVYVVFGSTGEYSDGREWNVKAFLDQAAAESFVTTLNEWCAANKVAEGRRGYDEPALVNPFDQNFQNDYTGTIYGATPVELVE